MKQLSKNIYIYLFSLLIALLIISSFISYFKIRQFDESVKWLLYSNEVKNNISEVWSTLKDAETGQRGYLLSNDTVFLRPYLGAEQKINRLLSKLDSILAYNSIQHNNLLALKIIVNDKIFSLKNNLRILSGLPTSPVKDSLMLLGKNKMDEARILIASMLQKEDAQFRQLQQTKDQSAAITSRYLLGFSLLSILALTLLFWRLQKETNLRILTEEINSVNEIANKKIQLSENNLRNTILQAPVAMCIFKGPAHILELANQKMGEVWGRDIESIVGKPILDSLPEAKIQGFQKLLDEVYIKGKSFSANEAAVSLIRNGKADTIYLNYIYEPYKEPAGNITGIISVATEVTEQVIARKQIEENEQRVRLAVESGRLGTFEIDLVLNEIVFSERLAEIFGLDYSKTWNHLDLKNALHPDDLSIRNTAHDIALKTGSLLYEARVLWKDGSVHWIRTSGRVIRDSNISTKLYGTILDITNEKEAANKLAAIREQLELILRMVPSAIQLRNSKGELLFVNDEAAIITGFSSAVEMMQEKDPEYIYKRVISNLEIYDVDGKPFDYNRIPTAITFSTGQTAEAVFRTVNKHTGESNWIMSKSSALLDEAGKVSLVISTNTDITKQKKGELELRRFKHMTENATEPFILMREDATFAYLNDVALECWGYSREEAKVLRVPDIDPIYNSINFIEVFMRAQKSKIPTFETLYRKKDGTTYPVEVNMGGLILEGQPHLFAVARDITERKKNEDALKESEEKFRGLVETLPHLVWITDEKGQPFFASGSWKEYSGFNPYEMDNWNTIVHPEDMEEITKSWLSSLESGKPYHAEVRLKNKDNEYRWHVVEGVPLKNDEGKIYRWIGAFTDMNEQKLKEQMKDEFISIASHEMKTPITTAKGYLELLLLTIGAESPMVSLYAQKASKSIDRLLDLVVELLDASKIQNGKLNYNISIFNFNEMLDETIENIQQGSNSHIITKYGMSLRNLKGDKLRLQQVVINLLSNALKYSPNNDSVIVEVLERENELQVSVKDYGIGMNKQHLDKIFDRYYRVQEHAIHFQGLGIGLYISYDIIKRHEGKMWAESEPGNGSTFYFTIPIYSD